ncbi:hypothetical protein H5410_045859 [Solanum commersonii]|uniref:Uncharacterized protein n=1 Tax=Solanum commersonii TaxID=4109 RepID=A0A9J5XAP7_SOLCO|nr:hypothetical protein H5410_045859 [Solanum commersonii]
MRLSKRGGSDLYGGQDEGSENEMVLECAKEGYRPIVRRCERLVVGGMHKGRGRPEKYWREVIRLDMAQLHITKDMT